MTDESRETFGFPIEVTLREDEIKAKLDRNADIDRKMIGIKEEKAAANSGFNEELKGLRKEQNTLLEAISVGKAKVEVQCYQERDDRRGMMLTMRCDSGHIVDERALTAEEREVDDRQGELSFAKGDSAATSADSDEGDEGQSDPDLENTLDEYNAQQNAAGADDDSEDEALAH